MKTTKAAKATTKNKTVTSKSNKTAKAVKKKTAKITEATTTETMAKKPRAKRVKKVSAIEIEPVAVADTANGSHDLADPILLQEPEAVETSNGNSQKTQLLHIELTETGAREYRAMNISKSGKPAVVLAPLVQRSQEHIDIAESSKNFNLADFYRGQQRKARGRIENANKAAMVYRHASLEKFLRHDSIVAPVSVRLNGLDTDCPFACAAVALGFRSRNGHLIKSVNGTVHPRWAKVGTN